MSLYLLLKQHNDTGLKYLCKHEANSFEECVKYRGSGTYWKKHLKKHGNNVNTTCLFVTDDKNEFRKIATKYSEDFNIVVSEDWANLTIEQGQGGAVYDADFYSVKSKQIWNDAEYKQKHMPRLIENILKCQPLAAQAAKLKLQGVKKSSEHIEKMKGKRPHVCQSGSNNNNAKKIKTPYGTFNSIKDAEKNIDGFTYRMIWNRLQSSEGWEYIYG